MSMIISPYQFGSVAPSPTKSLLHFDGTDGSTTFPDESGIAWTASGQAQLDTSFSQFGSASLILDGVQDYIETPPSSRFSILGDFTVECWVRRTQTGRDAICTRYSSSASGFAFDVGPSDELRMILGTGSFIICSSGASTVPVGTWAHVAGVRSDMDLLVFIDGFLRGTLAITGTPADHSNQIYIGTDPLDTSRDFAGHIDEFRFSDIARYTSDFTPSGPFTYPG